MSEGSLWQTLHRNVRWQQANRHEDMVGTGVADVSYAHNFCHGWLELKFVPSWPKRAATVVRLPHFTDDQRGWLKAKGEAGGNTWLLLQVGREYLLFYWDQLPAVGHSTRAELVQLAGKNYWAGRLDYVKFLEVLACGEHSL